MLAARERRGGSNSYGHTPDRFQDGGRRRLSAGLSTSCLEEDSNLHVTQLRKLPLYPLSYQGEAPLTGVEPAFHGFVDRCSSVELQG